MPAVSVIIPNYRHAPFLPRRIESVLAQSFADFEVIILDDASPDNSVEVIGRYLGDPRVRFQPNTVNSGSPFIQWNRGVALAQGEFIWIAESDDVAEPTLLATLVDLLRRHPRAGVAYCQSWRMDATDKVIGSMTGFTEELDPQRWQHDFTATGREECARYLVLKNTIPNASAVVFRRDVFLRAGGAVTNLRLTGDWLTWARMLLISDVVFTAAHLNYFREHGSSVRATTRHQTFLAEKWLIQCELLRKGAVSTVNRRIIARESVNEHLSRIRLGAGGFDLRELFRGIRTYWPIYIRAPWTALAAGFRRVLQ